LYGTFMNSASVVPVGVLVLYYEIRIKKKGSSWFFWGSFDSPLK
jgi:hypothetical protein